MTKKGKTRLYKHNFKWDDHLWCSTRGCYTLPTWLEWGGCYQRYWCDTCVKKTSVYKRTHLEGKNND